MINLTTMSSVTERPTTGAVILMFHLVGGLVLLVRVLVHGTCRCHCLFHASVSFSQILLLVFFTPLSIMFDGIVVSHFRFHGLVIASPPYKNLCFFILCFRSGR